MLLSPEQKRLARSGLLLSQIYPSYPLQHVPQCFEGTVAVPRSLLLLCSNVVGPRCLGVGRGWSRLKRAGDLARNPKSLVHAPVVGCEFVLASEAVAFSTVLASHHRALKQGRIFAVCGSGVAPEILPTLCAEAAILDGTMKGLGFFRTLALPVMGLCMSSTVFRHNLLPSASRIHPRCPVAAYKATMLWANVDCIIDTYRKTYDTSTFSAGVCA